MMKMLETAKSKITMDKDGENLPHLEITEIVLVHCNIVNNYYQKDSRALYTFPSNKLYDQLPDISRKKFAFLKPLIQNLLQYGLLIKILNL